MTSDTKNSDRERARKRNQRLAKRVTRWARWRLGFVLLFLAAAFVTSYYLTPVVSIPLFGFSILFFVWYFDATEEARDIRKRDWNGLLLRGTREELKKSSPTLVRGRPK